MRTLLRNPLILVLFVCLSIAYSFSLYTTTKKSAGSQVTSAQLGAELQSIQAENTQLETELQQANTPFAQEKILRDELLLQKPGEIVLQVVAPPEQSVEPEQTATHQTPWEEWQEVIF